MACLWVSINHSSHGLVKISRNKRHQLEFASSLLLLLTWSIIVPAIFQVVSCIPFQPQEPHDHLNYSKWAAIIFLIGNGAYLLTTLILAFMNLAHRKDLICGTSSEGKPDLKDHEKIEYCCDICNPLDSLRISHHLQHRFLLMACILIFFSFWKWNQCSEVEQAGEMEKIVMGYIIIFTIPLCVLSVVQCILSYLYAEDIALCGVNICCVLQLLFIRRYPKDSDDSALSDDCENTIQLEETTDKPQPLGKYTKFQNQDPTFSKVKHESLFPRTIQV